MKQFKYLLLMLMAVLTFSSCEKDDDDVAEGGVWDYLSLRDVKCEKVGNALRIDFKLKNISGQSLQDVTIQSIKAEDNTGKSYNYYGNKIAFDGGMFDHPDALCNVTFKKGEEKSGTIVIAEFDEGNIAKNARLLLDVYIGESDKGYLSGTTNYFSWKDNRSMTGIQTNDNVLTYTNSSCFYKDGTCYWTFYVTSQVSINDFFFRPARSHSEIRDNTGETYYFEVSFDDGNYKDGFGNSYMSTSLKAGVSKKVTIRVRNFLAQATEFSGYINAASGDYPLTCDYIMFNGIQVGR